MDTWPTQDLQAQRWRMQVQLALELQLQMELRRELLRRQAAQREAARRQEVARVLLRAALLPWALALFFVMHRARLDMFASQEYRELLRDREEVWEHADTVLDTFIAAGQFVLMSFFNIAWMYISHALFTLLLVNIAISTIVLPFSLLTGGLLCWDRLAWFVFEAPSAFTDAARPILAELWSRSAEATPLEAIVTPGALILLALSLCRYVLPATRWHHLPYAIPSASLLLWLAAPIGDLLMLALAPHLCSASTPHGALLHLVLPSLRLLVVRDVEGPLPSLNILMIVYVLARGPTYCVTTLSGQCELGLAMGIALFNTSPDLFWFLFRCIWAILKIPFNLALYPYRALARPNPDIEDAKRVLSTASLTRTQRTAMATIIREQEQRTPLGRALSFILGRSVPDPAALLSGLAAKSLSELGLVLTADDCLFCSTPLPDHAAAVLVPCLHIACCWDCCPATLKTIASPWQCPVCRLPALGAMCAHVPRKLSLTDYDEEGRVCTQEALTDLLAHVQENPAAYLGPASPLSQAAQAALQRLLNGPLTGPGLSEAHSHLHAD
eukprot:m.190013 g.190013  ORF g.190013 m.190013 type:complete len:556 (-) comp10040_c1_seq1:32-1699(-)